MNDCFSWQYDEFQQIGTDYSSKTQVDIYDTSHSDFRDMDAESLNILDSLEIEYDNALIDFGSGTGTFAINAAKRCEKVYAVDVSKAMIECATAKAMKAEASNIEFHNAGFLTYVHKDQPVDAIVTTFAFHHLPDFWKGIALKRLNGMLKPDGKLYIHDVVMTEADALENIAVFLDKMATAGGDLLRKDCEKHFKEEYSTYDWVMDRLLTQSGFVIKSKKIDDGVLGTYTCAKGQ